jgi:LacI family transcriptional regulator
VAHLAGPAAQTTMADRAVGYAAALAEQGLPAEVVPTDGSAEEGLRATRGLLGRPPGGRPDALFAATDRLAVAALGAAMDAEVCVPRELAVVGFDDVPLAAYLRPSLSSVAQPARQLGEAAIRLALQLLAGGPAEPVVLPAHLVIRASSRC